MDEKIALVLDELSNKVLGYKTNDITENDIRINADGIAVVQQACYDQKDVYYIDGALVVRDKDPNEYNNKYDMLGYETGEIQSRIKRGIAERKDVSELMTRAEHIRKEIEKLKTARVEQNKARLIAEQSATKFKYYCSVCLIIRDENEYLKEWLEWHIAQGVEHFYIYDHDSKQPVSEFIKTLDDGIREKITVHAFGGSHGFAQHDAYNDCLNRYKKESRWIGFIDADEMVRVKCGCTLPELLKNYERYAGLFMLWIVYDANGQIKKSSGSLRERFTHVTPTHEDDGMGKTFVQPTFIKSMVTHNGFVRDGFTVVDENCTAVGDGEMRLYGCTDELVCVDHYYTKSYEEWKEKMRRGSCDPIYSRKYADFFIYNPDMEHCREDIVIEQKYEVSEKQ